MAEEIDKNILDDENLVRGICTPHHFDLKKGKLLKGAFKQKLPTKGVSVYRSHIMTSNACKQKAKALASDDKRYVGLAVVMTEAVRSSGATVEDTREKMFYGHADVFLMLEGIEYAPEPGEPPPPEIMDVWNDRIKAIIEKTKVFLDDQPDHEDWQGPDLACA